MDKKYRIAKSSLSDKVYHALREAILEGDLTPGQPLMENQLAKMLNVSKTPVRQALAALEKEGLVTGNTWQSKRVVDTDAQSLYELYLVREVLEGLAARLASANIDPKAIGKLQAHILKSEECLQKGDVTGFLEEDLNFHILISQVAGNKVLLDLLENIRSRIFLAQHLTAVRGGRAHLSIMEHKDIFTAIKNSDPIGAEKCMFNHISNLKEVIMGNMGGN